MGLWYVYCMSRIYTTASTYHIRAIGKHHLRRRKRNLHLHRSRHQRRREL